MNLMDRKIFCWFLIGLIVVVIDLQDCSANRKSDIQQNNTPIKCLLTSTSNNTSQITPISEAVFECRILPEDRKVQKKTNSGIKFVKAIDYCRLVLSAKEPFLKKVESLELFYNLSFIRKLQI